MDFKLINLDILFQFLFATDYDTNPPALKDVAAENAGALILVALLIVVSLVGLCSVWAKIYGKDTWWKALIPFYNFFTLFRAVDLNPYLSFSTALPLVGFVPLALFNFFLPRAFGLKGVHFGLAAVCFPWLLLLIIGFDPKYEYQYVKGKNVPFENSFRIPIPGEAGYDAAYTPNEVDAIGSQVSQAAALNMAKNEALRQEVAAREAEAAAREAAAAKPAATSKPTTEVSYDIFDNGTIEPTPPPAPEA